MLHDIRIKQSDYRYPSHVSAFMAALASRLVGDDAQEVESHSWLGNTLHPHNTRTLKVQRSCARSARERCTFSVRARAPRTNVELSTFACCAGVGPLARVHVQDIAGASSKARTGGRKPATSIGQRLETGSRIEEYINLHPELGRQPWRSIAEDCFCLQYTSAVRMRLRRCWLEWHEHSSGGAHTTAGSGGLAPSGRGVNARARYRRQSSTPRPRKMACLWFELLRWFVDEVEELRSRADSSLLLARARLLRDRLVAQGHSAADLPKVNKDFLRRWRLEFGLGMRATPLRLKISLTKATARVSCMLSNIFRLRHLWQLCHGPIPMRWVSYDQKPSWFNNAGLRPQLARRGSRKVGAREDHAGTRQRYSLMTTVQSWPPPVGAGPPKMAVLFKADSGARRPADFRKYID